MTKQEFIKKAETEKANFELHKRLIDFYLCDRENKNYSNDLKKFAERQVVDGNLLLSLMEYAEAYYEERSKLRQPKVISPAVCDHPMSHRFQTRSSFELCLVCRQVIDTQTDL